MRESCKGAKLGHDDKRARRKVHGRDSAGQMLAYFLPKTGVQLEDGALKHAMGETWLYVVMHNLTVQYAHYGLNENIAASS